MDVERFARELPALFDDVLEAVPGDITGDEKGFPHWWKGVRVIAWSV